MQLEHEECSGNQHRHTGFQSPCILLKVWLVSSLHRPVAFTFGAGMNGTYQEFIKNLGLEFHKRTILMSMFEIFIFAAPHPKRSMRSGA